MRRLTDDLVLSLKDQIRSIRYSLRSEAEAPGSALPETYRNMDFGPLGTVGAMIGTPMIRMADGLFTQVETVTLGLLEDPVERRVVEFPRPVTDFFARTGEPKASFTRVFYHEVKALLHRYGARHVLVSEHAIEELRTHLLARHGDLIWRTVARTAAQQDEQVSGLVQICAAIAVGFARIHPIQKVDLLAKSDEGRHLMLSPNLYCGMVLGLATAIATVHRTSRDLEGADIIESADAVVDARFDRLKIATQGKDPVGALSREFETMLPFLP